MDLAQAIRFIQSDPDPVLQARLAALIDADAAPPAVLDAIAGLQQSDGGWPLGGIAGRPSSLHETCAWLGILRELDQVESDAAKRGRDFLFQRQSPRGWWREAAELSTFAPPMWLDPESDASLVYTTALCAATLAAHGGEEELLAIDQANGWLQGQIASNGLLPGFRIYATAWAVPAYVAISHRDARPVKRMLSGLASLFSDEWDNPSLATFLQAFNQAGFPRGIKVIQRALAVLDKRQQPGGAWLDDDGQANAALTFQIVRAARRFGLR